VLLHAALLGSAPAAGERVATSPAQLRLWFSEPVEPALSRLSLENASGASLRLTPTGDPRDIRALLASVPPLEVGDYRVRWRVVSADGHPVGGEFLFTVLQGAAAPTQFRDAGAMTVVAAGALGPLVRAVALAALLALAGVLALRVSIVPQAGARVDRFASVLAAVTPVLLAVDFWLWLRGAAAGAPMSDVLPAALGTWAGRLSVLRLGASLLALWAVGLARRPGLGAALAAVAVLASGAIGHPAAATPLAAIPATMIHLVAVALWLGGLLCLLIDGSVAARVSDVALWAVVAIGVTGAVNGVLFLSAPVDLVRSRYGILLLAKVAGLGVLALFGWRHRFRLLPQLTPDRAVTLRRSVAWEVAVMVLVIVLAAFLAFTPIPVSEAHP
jgi:copper transport protein